MGAPLVMSPHSSSKGVLPTADLLGGHGNISHFLLIVQWLPLPFIGTIMASCLHSSFFATIPFWDGGTLFIFRGLSALSCLLQSTFFVTFCFALGICKELCGLIFDSSPIMRFAIVSCHPLIVHLLKYLVYGCI